MDEFHYRIGWRSRGHMPGAHRGLQSGAGFEFTGHRALTDGGDPRRLDIRTSLRDPFERWQVRVFAQRSAVPVALVADLSASMAIAGRHDKWSTLSAFARTLAWSVARSGDLFGFVGCDDTVRTDLMIPSTQRRSAALEVGDRLAAARPSGPVGASALLEAAQWLPQRRTLVFLVSDFHFPLDTSAALLSSLRLHDVVPIVLWDPIETQVPEGHGLLRLQDSETGRHRLIWLRASLRERWRVAITDRRAALRRLCEAHGRPPLILEQQFDADQITRYFHAAH
jgi:hypothetical protein